MIFPQFARLTDVALLLLRIIVGIVFMTSGWKHLKDPEGRSKPTQAGGDGVALAAAGFLDAHNATNSFATHLFVALRARVSENH